MNPEDLKRRRKQLDQTQDGLAKLLGVTVTTVARWERGEVAIPALLDPALKHIEAEHKRRPTKEPSARNR